MMPARRFRRPNKQSHDFESNGIVGMIEPGWSYRAIGRHLQRTSTAVQSKVTKSFTNRTCLGHGRAPDSGTPKYHRSGATAGECLAECIAGGH
ncbi:hypothetical protein TNCV_2002911 [Trichonephila clavipes]|nr:hypothetical protein TNCV_2002911 [Trichonephila clavipes]